MKKYLIGYDKSKVQTVVFFDIQDFEAQTIRNMTVLTFSEDDIDYTYTGTNGVDFKEVSGSAPDFYYYEVLLKSGKKVNILDPNDMKNLTPAEVKEVEKELQKQLGGLTGQAKSNINQTFGGSSSSSSGGCGGGYSGRSYGGCGGSYRSGC